MTGQNGSTRIVGVPAAPGVARGQWIRLGALPLPPPRGIAAHEVEAEVARLRASAQAAGRELRELAAAVRDGGHPDEAAIFSAQSAIARDPELLDAAEAVIATDKLDASTAVAQAARATANAIASLDDPLLRGRAADVLDVGDRIARDLAGLPTSPHRLERSAIVVAEDLAPSVTATLPRDLILGIALEGSSPTSHAAILARAFGIPAVVGASGLIAALDVAGGDAEVGIDGSRGDVLIAPDPSALADLDARAGAAAAAAERDRAEASIPAETTDGVSVTLLANVGSEGAADAAIELGAQGVGLFRTEFLFLDRRHPPSEEEQTDLYRTVVRAFAGRPVTIRLLDAGGDKGIPYIPIDPEENPFLGVRGLRLADRYRSLFVTQLRACMRAALDGPVRVMAPMVADVVDVNELLALSDEARTALDTDGASHGEVELGVMLEVPSAILTLPRYADRIAFASIGTNDLLQYTLAVDRGNPALERYRDPLHPAMLRLIADAVQAADAAGLSLSVCGEMAGEPTSALALVGLGIRSLSMSASSIPPVRRAIRATSAAALAEAAAAALAAPTAAEARACFPSP